MKQGITTLSTISVMLFARQRHHIMGHVFHALFTQSRAPCCHHTHTAFFDGFLNFSRCAAPQPIVVGQVGKTLAAFSIGTVTLNTIGVEHVFTDTLGLRVCGYLLNRHLAKFGIQGAVFVVGGSHFFFVLVGTGPIQYAFVVANAGVHHQIAHTENGG